MDRNNITTLQFTSLLCASLVGPAALNLVVVYVHVAGRMTLAILGVLFVLTAALMFLILKLQSSVGFQDPTDTLKYAFGRPAGSFLALAVTLVYLYAASIMLRIFIYILGRIFMPQTNDILLSIIVYLPVVVVALCGLRLYGNASTLLYVFIPVFFSLFILPTQHYTLSFLLPLWHGSLPAFLEAIPLVFFMLLPITASFYLLPYIKDRTHIVKSIWSFIILIFFLITFIFIAGVAFFGMDIISDILMPFYNLSSARRTTIMERTDIVFILLFVPMVGLTLSFYFNILLLSQKKLFLRINEEKPRWVIFALAILTIILSLGNIYGTDVWETISFVNFGYLGILLILITAYITAIIKRRRRHHASET